MQRPPGQGVLSGKLTNVEDAKHELHGKGLEGKMPIKRLTKN
jgi:hypothetical protein